MLKLTGPWGGLGRLSERCRSTQPVEGEALLQLTGEQAKYVCQQLGRIHLARRRTRYRGHHREEKRDTVLCVVDVDLKRLGIARHIEETI
jgi:hypothetical protein